MKDLKDLLEKEKNENKRGITFSLEKEKIRGKNLCFSAVIRQRKGERVKMLFMFRKGRKHKFVDELCLEKEKRRRNVLYI